jgi:hypothetical protein
MHGERCMRRVITHLAAVPFALVYWITHRKEGGLRL